MSNGHPIRDRLHIDCEKAITAIEEQLRRQVGGVLKRRGMVVAMSGGVDSSVCAGLAARAFGAERVLGLPSPAGLEAKDDRQAHHGLAGIGIPGELGDLEGFAVQ